MIFPHAMASVLTKILRLSGRENIYLKFSNPIHFDPKIPFCRDKILKCHTASQHRYKVEGNQDNHSRQHHNMIINISFFL